MDYEQRLKDRERRKQIRHGLRTKIEREKHRAKQKESDDSIFHILWNMGFTDHYIQRSLKVYDKHYNIVKYGYQIEIITEIIFRLTVKDKLKQSQIIYYSKANLKQALGRMNFSSYYIQIALSQYETIHGKSSYNIKLITENIMNLRAGNYRKKKKTNPHKSTSQQHIYNENNKYTKIETISTPAMNSYCIDCDDPIERNSIICDACLAMSTFDGEKHRLKQKESDDRTFQQNRNHFKINTNLEPKSMDIPRSKQQNGRRITSNDVKKSSVNEITTWLKFQFILFEIISIWAFSITFSSMWVFFAYVLWWVLMICITFRKHIKMIMNSLNFNKELFIIAPMALLGCLIFAPMVLLGCFFLIFSIGCFCLIFIIGAFCGGFSCICIWWYAFGKYPKSKPYIINIFDDFIANGYTCNNDDVIKRIFVVYYYCANNYDLIIGARFILKAYLTFENDKQFGNIDKNKLGLLISRHWNYGKLSARIINFNILPIIFGWLLYHFVIWFGLFYRRIFEWVVFLSVGHDVFICLCILVILFVDTCNYCNNDCRKQIKLKLQTNCNFKNDIINDCELRALNDKINEEINNLYTDLNDRILSIKIIKQMFPTVIAKIIISYNIHPISNI